MRLFVCIFPVLLPITASADEAWMFKAGFMTLDARGSFASAAGGLAGTPIDVDSTIRLRRSNGVTLESAIQFGDVRASLNYFPLDFSGSGQLSAPVQYNGLTFAAGDAVDARFKADVFDASLTYYLLNVDDIPTRMQLGVEAAVKVVSASSTLQDRTTGVSRTVSTSLPIPTLGARGRLAISDLVGLTGRAGYMGYAGNHFLDSEVQLEFSPLPTAGIYAGYRIVDLKVDRSGLLLNHTVSGPFVGGFIRF